LLAALAPVCLLPHVALRQAEPVAAVPVPLPAGVHAAGAGLYVEPLALSAPGVWPEELGAWPAWQGLGLGLACYAIWCFALTPRRRRKSRGLVFGLRVMMARVVREISRPPLLWIALLGLLTIVGVWIRGGPAWIGLLTALVGLVGGGSMVWAVRIVGSAALRKEAMGFGDVTLMMMIGAFLGWQPTIFIFFLAPFAGLVVGILQVVLRRDDVIPYGPFLCLATLVVVCRWADFWNARPESFQRFFDVPWLVPAVLTVGVVMLGAMLVLWRNIKEAIFGVDSDDPQEGDPSPTSR
jgi:leader peptidase (prepilin peptidase) / N-methyltransferase